MSTSGRLSSSEQASCSLTRNEAGVVTSADDAVFDVLGWRPDQLIGSPSTTLIHPEDQPSAVAAWFEMAARPGNTTTWTGRYRTAVGGWQWVETENTNRLDDEHDPTVVTVMRRITVDETSIAEELRSRRQILSHLADAVPVGLFQIDREFEITFTNKRFLEMFGPEAAATCEAQFEGVLKEDCDRLRDALECVLSGESIDGTELRFRRRPGDPAAPPERTLICELSLRPLTDEAGGVSGAIGCVSDVTERVELRRELELRASVDGATGCLNRQATMDLLDLVLQRRERSRGTAVVFIDIDDFKDVNDRFGHAAGDAVLVEAASRMRNAIRGDDQLGRIGGDEFLVICPQVAEASKALEVGERLAKAMHAKVETADEEICFQASVGVAWSDRPLTPDELVAEADKAMYRSKRIGLGEAVLFSGG